MATQSSSATLENCLPAMDFLLGLFEEAKVRYRDDPFMASRVNSAWSKLDKYYTKTNDSAAYVAALVLDPGMKWEYVNSTWESEWIPNAKAMVAQLWKKYRPPGDPASDLISIVVVILIVMLLTSSYPIHLVPGSSSNQAEGLIILMNIFDISESPQFRTII